MRATDNKNMKDIFILEAISKGFECYSHNIKKLSAISAIYLLLLFTPTIIQYVFFGFDLTKVDESWLKYLNILKIIQMFLAVALNVGMIRIARSVLDTNKFQKSQLFECTDCFWSAVGSHLLYSCLCSIYILLAIFAAGSISQSPAILTIFIAAAMIPTVITMLKYRFCLFLVADKNSTPFRSLIGSDLLTRGVKRKLLVFELICGLINLGGSLLLFVGLIVTIPATLLAKMYVYNHLLEESDLKIIGLEKEKNYETSQDDSEQ